MRPDFERDFLDIGFIYQVQLRVKDYLRSKENINLKIERLARFKTEFEQNVERYLHFESTISKSSIDYGQRTSEINRL